MYTIGTVAEKTGYQKAAIRYFARKKGLKKELIDNRLTYIFNDDDYFSFLNYRKGMEMKKEKNNYYDKKLENLIRMLKDAGSNGIERLKLQKMLNITSDSFSKLIVKASYYPIGEDSRIDNKIYWVG